MIRMGAINGEILHAIDQHEFLEAQWPILQLLVGVGAMANFWALLFILGQKSFYLDTVKALTSSRA
jgi:hypothetical protein